jgi:sec-independent protein translocase protein TatA
MGLGALQPGHLIVILVIVLLIFGPGKLPELGKSLGEGIKELKRATGEHDDASASTSTATEAAKPEPTPIAVAAARVCPSCHGSVPAGDKFCGNCGASMEPATRTA